MFSSSTIGPFLGLSLKDRHCYALSHFCTQMHVSVLARLVLFNFPEISMAGQKSHNHIIWIHYMLDQMTDQGIQGDFKCVYYGLR